MSQGPLPLERLLRSSGEAAPSESDPSEDRWPIGGWDPHDDPRTVAGDAARLLAVVKAGVPPAWSTGPFVARVAVARRQLAPITSCGVLEASFGREASNRLVAGRTSVHGLSAVRIAYALRWLEIAAGLRLPPWEDWSEPCTTDR